MELLTGYLWEISGEYERQNEVSGEFTRQSREKFVIYKEGASSAWYCLTETEEVPELEWGSAMPHVPAPTTIGQPLAVLDADGYADYTAWIASADGVTNECVILLGSC